MCINVDFIPITIATTILFNHLNVIQSTMNPIVDNFLTDRQAWNHKKDNTTRPLHLESPTRTDAFTVSLFFSNSFFLVTVVCKIQFGILREGRHTS